MGVGDGDVEEEAVTRVRIEYMKTESVVSSSSQRVTFGEMQGLSAVSSLPDCD